MVNTLSNTGGPLDWFQALPKITRTYAISTVVVAAMISWNLPGVSVLLLQWPKVWPGLQVWRLVTHVIVMGKFSLTFLIRCVWILTYGAQLESVVYENNPEDYLFLFLFSAAAFAALSLGGAITGTLSLVLSGTSMVMVLIYIWSKEFPEKDIKLYGIIKIKGFYLPFAFMGIDVLMGASLIPSALGIAVGHTWYFLSTLLPRSTGQEYLKTPAVVKKAAIALGVAAPPRRAPDDAVTASGFRAFKGKGRRLTD